MRLRWRTFWFLVGGWLLLGGLWLVWRLPDQGFFRLALHPLELPPDGVALVELRQGQPGNSYALAAVGIGWRAFWALWPLMLISLLAGYPLGVLGHWLCRLVTGEKPSPRARTAEEEELLALMVQQSTEEWQRMIEVQDLRQEVQRARKEAAGLRETLSEGQDSTRSLHRKVASLERDLSNARAKIKRLEGKQRGKPLADEQWSEYIDDM